MENSAKNTGTEQAYAVAYLRLSKQDKECGIPELDSIESQRLIISQYCAQNGLSIVGEYVDDGASGKNFERENFSRMLVELPKTRAKYIITKDLSRLGRTIESLKVIKEQFASLGVIYIAVNDGYDSRKPDPSLPIRLSLNQLQLEDTAQKVAAALDARRKEGRYCAPPPYGYIRNPRNRSQIIPNEDTAPIIRRIFERAAAGHSKRRIARDLTADRIPTPSMYNVLQHMDERDGITVSRNQPHPCTRRFTMSVYMLYCASKRPILLTVRWIGRFFASENDCIPTEQLVRRCFRGRCRFRNIKQTTCRRNHAESIFLLKRGMNMNRNTICNYRKSTVANLLQPSAGIAEKHQAQESGYISKMTNLVICPNASRPPAARVLEKKTSDRAT